MRTWLGFVLLAAVGLPLAAEPVWIGADTFATVSSGTELLVDFSVWNYGRNNPGVSPYPLELGLLVAGPEPGSPREAVPGSSLEYFPDLAFFGRLESWDGAVSVSLGTLWVTAGTVARSDGSLENVGVIDARTTLSLEESAALFATDLQARFRLLALGDAFTIGYGPGYTVANAVSVPGVRGEGPVSTAGIVTGVALEPGFSRFSGDALLEPMSIEAPEPSTFIPLAVAGALFALLRRARRS
jgi:hypothetical protein